MNKELSKIRENLRERSEKEADILWRLARRAIAHGCRLETVAKIREEADWCFRTGTTYPERLVDQNSEYRFQYAFKY